MENGQHETEGAAAVSIADSGRDSAGDSIGNSAEDLSDGSQWQGGCR